MKGRRVILTNRAFTTDELFQFMELYWNKAEYNGFRIGAPTDPNSKLYVLLPATSRHLIIVYSRGGGKKDCKVVLSVAMTPAGIGESFMRSIPTSNVFFGAAKIGSIAAQEKDRTGATEEILQIYTDYMTNLLGNAGYLKGQTPVMQMQRTVPAAPSVNLQPRFCSACGAKLKGGSFCTQCGKKLG